MAEVGSFVPLNTSNKPPVALDNEKESWPAYSFVIIYPYVKSLVDELKEGERTWNDLVKESKPSELLFRTIKHFVEKPEEVSKSFNENESLLLSIPLNELVEYASK